MKKYLTLAAILGALAFISISYLAQANDKMDAAPAAAMHVADAAPSAPSAPPAPPAPPTPFAIDSDMCTMLSSAPTTEGSVPTTEAKDTAFKKCMIGKGHTEEELKKADDAKKADMKEMPPTAPVPAAK